MTDVACRSDGDLIDDFAATRSAEAFAELARRHVDLVYSAARRQLFDDADAQDATQQVFTLLAQKAGKLRETPQLSAWLFASTRYVCANVRRTRARRQQHERKAAAMRSESDEAARESASTWSDIAPLLDEAIDSLPEAERSLLLLRFFERRSLREVGEALKISEDAARKRVDRATDKLRAFFARAGVATATPAVAIEAALLTHAVTEAPATLGGAVAAKGAASVAAITAAGVGTGVKIGAIAATVLIVGGGVATLVAVGSAKRNAIVAAAVRNVPGEARLAGRPSTPPGPPLPPLPPVPPLGELSATLSNGLRVELLGVSGGEGDTPQRWWTASGAPTTRPVVSTDFDDAMRDYPKANMLRFIVRTLPPELPAPKNNLDAVGRALRQWEIGLMPIPTPDFRSQSCSNPQMGLPVDRGMAKIAIAWDKPPPATMRLALGVASGAWVTTVETRTPAQNTTHTPRADKPNHKMTFANFQAARGLRTATQVNVFYPGDLYQYGVDQPESRIVAVVNGEEIAGRRLTSGNQAGGKYGDLVEFDGVAPETITALRYQTRAYEPVIFENISTRPGVRTKAKVTTRPAGASMR